MDVCAKNRGRPHQKVHFSAAPVMGRNILTQQGRPGVRVRNVPREIRAKMFMFMLFFSSLIEVALVLHEQYHITVVSRLISDGHFFFRGNPISITDTESCCQKINFH